MLQEVKDICEPIIAEHMKDIPYRIEYVDRGVRYLGKCVFKRGRSNYYILKFSSIYFNQLYKNGDIDQIKDTVLHEVAHALTREVHGRGHGHDSYWKFIAQRIGCCGERTASTGIKPYKYIYECPKCHHKFYRLRKLNGNYYCMNCTNEQLDENRIFLAEENKTTQVKNTL